MRRPLIKNIALILALAVSQWLVFAHAVSHPALALDPNCQVCVHASGIDTGALARAHAPLAPPATGEAPRPTSVDVAAAPAPVHQRIRGPPRSEV